MQPNEEAEGRAQGAEAGAALGRTLVQARIARGLTVEEIATELRIEPRLLDALEQCRFEELGPAVFAKGYLKQYGARLGLKYSDLLAEYYRLVEPQEVALAPSRTIKLRDERQITVWIIAALAIALLAVFLMVWWLGDSPGGPTPAATGPEIGGEVPAPVASDAGAARVEAPAAVEDGAVAVAEEPESPATPAANEPDAGSSAAGLVSPTAAAPALSADAPVAGGVTAPAGPRTSIEVAFLEDCWLEVSDVHGTSLFYGLGQAGARTAVSGEPPIDVFLGNANGVAITVDGRPYDVPSRNRQGNLARFVITGPTD
jgi:cytoskeleton protein RodZ